MEQIQKKQLTEALVEIALFESKEVSVRFAEINAYLQKQEHLAALGTLQGLEEKFKFVEVVLRLASKISQK